MSDSSPMALVLSRVSTRFKDEPRHSAGVLHEVSFSVPKGAFVSVIGSSGSGKSTLMRVILGLMPHTSGDIVRNFIRPAMVFQSYALFPWLTAVENVAFGLKMQGVGKEERERIARAKLREVGLEHHDNHYPAALSGGQRQRVGLARALALSPDLLIMDEPFSNLDTITADLMKEDVLRLWRTYGMTIIMVNHLIPDTIQLSDQIIVLSGQPGHIEKTLAVDLPRPRDTRSPHFYKEVDQLTDIVRKIS